MRKTGLVRSLPVWLTESASFFVWLEPCAASGKTRRIRAGTCSHEDTSNCWNPWGKQAFVAPAWRWFCQIPCTVSQLAVAGEASWTSLSLAASTGTVRKLVSFLFFAGVRSPEDPQRPGRAEVPKKQMNSRTDKAMWMVMIISDSSRSHGPYRLSVRRILRTKFRWLPPPAGGSSQPRGSDPCLIYPLWVG